MAARSHVLVYGLAVAGVSTVRALLRHGHHVVAADDTITPSVSLLPRSSVWS